MRKKIMSSFLALLLSLTIVMTAGAADLNIADGDNNIEMVTRI